MYSIARLIVFRKAITFNRQKLCSELAIQLKVACEKKNKVKMNLDQGKLNTPNLLLFRRELLGENKLLSTLLKSESKQMHLSM